MEQTIKNTGTVLRVVDETGANYLIVNKEDMLMMETQPKNCNNDGCFGYIDDNKIFHPSRFKKHIKCEIIFSYH